MIDLSEPTLIASELRVRRLPRWVPYAAAVGAAVLAYLVFSLAKLMGGGWVLTAVGAVLIFVIGLSAISTVVEGRRAAVNRMATTLIYAAFTLALLPLVSVVLTLVDKGRTRLASDFFHHSTRNITALAGAGGSYNAT